jgi:hypothetical protein
MSLSLTRYLDGWTVRFEACAVLPVDGRVRSCRLVSGREVTQEIRELWNALRSKNRLDSDDESDKLLLESLCSQIRR